MSEQLPERAPGSPGLLGYVVAVAASLVALAAELVLLDAVDDGVAWREVLPGLVLVITLGALPAAVIGSVGCVAVHLLTWNASAQRWHVAAAALVGLLAGAVVTSGDAGAGLLLGAAAGLGRLAVVPLARARAGAYAWTSTDR